MPVDLPILRDIETRRERAVEGAKRALQALETRGITAVVTGSLADGRFGPDSDVDILVTRCPKDLKYAIEGIVEDCLAGLPFDVICLDEVPSWRAKRFVQRTADARSLR
jgi:predicted nucleotidyltransferase